MTGRKNIVSNEQAEQIESICKRLQHSVTQIQIINWLRNFEKEESNIALRVLNSLRYFSIPDIIYEFDESIKRILNEYPKHDKYYLHGIGDFGESGTTLIYYIKKTPTYQQNESKFKVLSHLKKLKQQGLKSGDCLVLIDDIIGSGKSLQTYYNHNISQQLSKEQIKIKTLVLCLAYMNESIKLLNETIDNLKIFGTGYVKAFSSGSSVFGYRPKMLPVREFCFKYGIELFECYDRELKKQVKHPLGFNNSQSLIVFAHSSPNNTLPIIWSNKNNWQPLYPRSSYVKISQSKDFRSETIHWLNIAYQLNLLQNKQSLNYVYFHDMNYRLLAVIRLKKRKSIDSIICQILGLSINELNEVYTQGQSLTFFDNLLNLTINADEIYDQIKRKIKIANTQERRKYRKENNGQKIYVPKIFLGKS
ncbi:hypothetical protein [uncultured Draconibacterium sp.]|uniref:phosphoribosyltransferase-like protein n=1 Tax=uncultured Draconibacterium sp. TaxID=1573823 RepID=UPI0029C899FE|nr:hypothetical protein [uncultured Draconibacterium sp.]